MKILLYMTRKKKRARGQETRAQKKGTSNAVRLRGYDVWEHVFPACAPIAGRDLRIHLSTCDTFSLIVLK